MLTHGEYSCRCLAQTLCYRMRASLVLVRDAEELFSMRLHDQAQNVSLLVVSTR